MNSRRAQLRIVATATSIALLLAVALMTTGTEHAGGAYPGAVNGQITFMSTRDGSGGQQVFVMGPRGENPTNISNNDAVPDERPSFSADGQSIVLTGHPDFTNDATPSEELFLVNADGTNRRRLTATPTDESQGSISPDGSRIAFQSFANPGYPELHVIAADGSGRSVLLGGDASSSWADPKWSPDGTRIALTRYSQGDEVCVLVVSSVALTCLTDDTNDLAYQPDWSPDGSKIAFVRDPFVIVGQKVESNAEIWVMNADGSGKTQLTNNPRSDSQPAWSPDGTKIAFTRRPQGEDGVADPQSGDGEIWVMNADGSGQTNLTNHPENDADPSWQPLGAGVSGQPPAFRSEISVPNVLTITARSTPRVAASPSTRFRISKPASVKLALERRVLGIKRKAGGRTLCRPAQSSRVSRRKRCRAWDPQGWLVRTSKGGRNRISLAGRIDRKALRPGIYRIRAGAVDSIANPARQRTSRAFRVVRR